MYRLTLTGQERRAINWIGNRYAHGDKLAHLLWIECEYPNDADWLGADDITFTISEYCAYEIKEIGYDCNHRWDYFAPALRDKMNDFIEMIE